MNIKEKATAYHKAGYNCAQAVLAACNEYTGLDDSAALAVSAGFGGGVRSGEICGAVSGAVMALGLTFPFNNAEDTDAKNRIAALAKECVAQCMESHGCVRCSDLKANGISCSEIIAEMAAIAEDMIIKTKEK